jgi:hypothetical protein
MMQSLRLHVVLRTCDSNEVHQDWRRRYCHMPKSEIVVGCVRSLVRSIQAVQNHTVELTVLDDHSSSATLAQLRDLIQPVNATLIQLAHSGYNHSAHQQWIHCRDSHTDLVYSTEDDYLHETGAVQAMIDSWQIFDQKMNHTPVVLYPFDAPEEYANPQTTCYVVHGSDRHWRTGVFSTNTLMCEPKLMQQHWDLFETLAVKYNGDYLNPRQEHWEEANTIWRIWNQGPAVRFNPIPSLALHMQFDEQLDPFINWQSWWNKYAV